MNAFNEHIMSYILFHVYSIWAKLKIWINKEYLFSFYISMKILLHSEPYSSSVFSLNFFFGYRIFNSLKDGVLSLCDEKGNLSHNVWNFV